MDIKSIIAASIKKYFTEVAQPKSPNEQRFVDQHTIEFWPHPVAFDSQFDGTIQKDTSRDADYQPGEDEAVYDQAYGEEAVTTGFAHLQELSRDTVKSYISKRVDQARHHNKKSIEGGGFNKGHFDAASQAMGKAQNASDYQSQKDRTADRNVLSKSNFRKKYKITHSDHDAIAAKGGVKYMKGSMYKGKVKAESTEESGFTHLQELSKDTINSYYKKAATQAGPLGVKKAKANKQITPRIRSGKTLNGYTPKDALTPDEAHTFKKRSTGMARARHSKIYNESFTPGELKFKDGSKTVVKESDASILNKLYSSLDTVRQKDMKEHVGKSVKNYKAVLEFAIATKGE
jgi:hypothetical protein